MDGRSWILLAAIATLIAAGPSTSGPYVLTKKKGEPSRAHPGQVVDFDTKAGIEGASAKAYGSQEREGSEPCPGFKDRLSADTTDKVGQFKFTVERSTYTAVYCKDAYHPRVETTNRSEKDGTPVRPTPVKLMPFSKDVPAYKDLVAGELSSFLSDLRYLRAARPDQFHEALHEAAETMGDPFLDHALESALDRPERVKPESR